MNWLLVFALMLGGALQTGCGDDPGADVTTLCAEVPVVSTEALRVQAVYHAGDALPEVIADVPVVDQRACLSLRPPAGPLHRVTHAREIALFIYESGRDPITTLAIPIDLGVYEDLDSSGDLGPGDRIRSLLSGGERARVPMWLDDFERYYSLQPTWQISNVSHILAPGARPFAVTGRIDATAAWDGRGIILMRGWPEALTLPPTPPGTACNLAESWPRCRTIEEVPAAATLRLVDPRVDASRITTPISGFDPVASLPPAEEPVPERVSARDCARIDDLLVAREVVRLPRQSAETCVCTLWTRTRWVIAPSADPPPWLSCDGRPLEGEAAEALAEAAGLVR